MDFYRQSQQSEWKSLNEVFENPKPIVEQSKPKLIVSSNSIAARKAAEQKRIDEQKRAAQEKAI